MAGDRGNRAGSLEQSEQSKRSGTEVQGRWPTPEVDEQGSGAKKEDSRAGMWEQKCYARAAALELVGRRQKKKFCLFFEVRR